MSSVTFSRSVLSGVVLAGLAGPALALDAETFVDTLNAALAASGGKIGYSTATVNGTTVTLNDVSLEMVGEDENIDAGDFVFEGVEETSDGGYAVESLNIEDIDVSEDDVRVTMRGIVVEGIDIPPEDAAEDAEFLLYERAATGPIAVTADGRTVFSAAGVESVVAPLRNDAGYGTEFLLSDMSIDLGGIEDAKTRDALMTMGYETLTGEVSFEAYWERDTGELEIAEYAIVLDDVGVLMLSLELAGYTPQFIQSLQDMQEQAMAADDDVQAQQAMGLSMLGMMQQLVFNSAAVRFEDDSVTAKALDYVGSEQGVSGEQMAQALKGMLPLALAQLGNPALQKEITAAVSTFLDDPQSLTIAAVPDEPVPFAAIMGAAMGNPQSLPDVLSVGITAND